MPSSYQQDNDALLQSFMERTYFKAWKETNPEVIRRNEGFYGNYHSLEFGINQRCDLNCKYCYLQKFGEEYYPKSTTDKDKILENSEILLSWLWENQYHPMLEIFSGDPLIQTIGLQVLELMIKYAEDGKKISEMISIPTNMGVLLHPKKKEKLIELMDRANKVCVRVGLSASVDGKFLEENRPFKNKNYIRDDKFYHELFTWARKYGIGFHPMVYSDSIHKWKDNFLWFQKKFAEYGLPWTNIYLLEVRNQEWTVEQCQELYKFVKWLVHWTWDRLGRDAQAFGYGGFFNILSSTLSSVGRGIGCSIQSSLQMRIGDLSWGLCHRLFYDKYICGGFKVENGKITGVKAHNFEVMLAVGTSTVRNFPPCEKCIIKHLCSAGCLGSNFETTGDLFATPPSVCRMEHYKIMGILEGMEEIGVLNSLLSRLGQDKQDSVIQLLKTRKQIRR